MRLVGPCLLSIAVASFIAAGAQPTGRHLSAYAKKNSHWFRSAMHVLDPDNRRGYFIL